MHIFKFAFEDNAREQNILYIKVGNAAYFVLREKCKKQQKKVKKEVDNRKVLM